MKKLVVYYSYEGNTKLIAENIASVIDADLLELKPRKEMKSKGVMKFVWGGKAAMMKEKPELLPFDTNVELYDTIFIGTPVWASTYAPAINTFFATQSFRNKKIALFCCHERGKGKIFAKMEKALEGNQIVGQMDFLNPLKNDAQTQVDSAKKWAVDLMRSCV